jgi:hypothetical protein
MRASESQRRPKLKSDFVLSNFQANNPEQDLSVVENIEEIVSDTIQDELESLIDEVAAQSIEEVEVNVQQLSSDLGLTDEAIAELVIVVDDMSDVMETDD